MQYIFLPSFLHHTAIKSLVKRTHHVSSLVSDNLCWYPASRREFLWTRVVLLTFSVKRRYCSNLLFFIYYEETTPSIVVARIIITRIRNAEHCRSANNHNFGTDRDQIILWPSYARKVIFVGYSGGKNIFCNLLIKYLLFLPVIFLYRLTLFYLV